MGARKGIPIGNVTSQIFANIYLNEFDRFVKHDLRIRAYLRYGDDFVIFGKDQTTVAAWRTAMIGFLQSRLRLTLHARNDIVLPCREGIRFLGYEIFPERKKLKRRTVRRIYRRLTLKNLSGYRGLVHAEANPERVRAFDWYALEIVQERNI